MKLLTTPKALENTFGKLLDRFSSVSFAVAWASDKFLNYRQLVRHRRKIGKCTVGLHFYQTHPGFIRAFLTDSRVKVITQPDGVFHPKVYLFENSTTDWTCLLGSANFTKGGFVSNIEACVLFTQADDPTGRIKARLTSLLKKYWGMGRSFDPTKLEAYERNWKRFRDRMRPIRGDFGGGLSGKSVFESEILNATWSDYFARVRDDPGFEGRLKVITAARRMFRRYGRLANMPEDAQRGIAGLKNTAHVPWGWFGSMRVARHFLQRIRAGDAHFSAALDAIPLTGEVSKDQYLEFVDIYRDAFPGGVGHGLGTATRLLAMKRPDYFVCLDARNKAGLCDEFGISIGHHDYERYWDAIIERILVAEWWASPRPRDNTQSTVWDGRAAFLDSVYYDG
jgi:hypothetical protein